MYLYILSMSKFYISTFVYICDHHSAFKRLIITYKDMYACKKLHYDKFNDNYMYRYL